MIKAYIKKYYENEGKTNKDAKRCIDLIEKMKLCDKEVASILAYSLDRNSTRGSKELISLYINEGKGSIRVFPTSIQIDGVDIKEEDILDTTNTDESKIRAKVLQGYFDMGKTKCSLSNCKKNASKCYLKIKIDSPEHKPTCIFCFECFRFISVAYLNAYVKDKKSHILWKCICGQLIPQRYLKIAVGRLLSDFYAIEGKADTNSMFCVECGIPTKPTNKSSQTTGSIKCDKHSK